jgi:hypothetical protein
MEELNLRKTSLVIGSGNLGCELPEEEIEEKLYIAEEDEEEDEDSNDMVKGHFSYPDIGTSREDGPTATIYEDGEFILRSDSLEKHMEMVSLLLEELIEIDLIEETPTDTEYEILSITGVGMGGGFHQIQF